MSRSLRVSLDFGSPAAQAVYDNATVEEVLSATLQVSQLLERADCGNLVSQRAATQVESASQALHR